MQTQRIAVATRFNCDCAYCSDEIISGAVLNTLAIQNYRSLRNVVVPLSRLNIVKGMNGSGKSNLYKALRLLADTASSGIVNSLAREGGLQSTMWAGPEKISRDMRAGRVPIQGTSRSEPVRLKLGFTGDAIDQLELIAKA